MSETTLKVHVRIDGGTWQFIGEQTVNPGDDGEALREDEIKDIAVDVLLTNVWEDQACRVRVQVHYDGAEQQLLYFDYDPCEFDFEEADL